MPATSFGPLGNSVVLALTQSSQTFALGTLPNDGPALRLQSLNSSQTAWYIKFGTSGAVTVSVTDGMRVVPGGQDAPVVVPVPTGSTHFAILCEGASGGVLASYGGYDDGEFSPIGDSQVVAVTTTDQRITLPALGTISPAIRLVSTSPAIQSLWIKLGDGTVTGSTTTSMKVSPGSVEQPTVIPVTSGQTHLSIFCEGVGGNVVLSPGQLDHSLPFPLSRPGDRWGVMPYVGSDGVMEIGRYIDFHNSDADASDFAVRLETNGGTVGLFETPVTGGVLKRIVSAIDSTLLTGDVLYYDGANFVRLGVGTEFNFIKGGSVPAWGASRTLPASAVQATTSGTAIDWTVPAANEITIHFDQVSLSGTNDLLIQIGDSGGVETSGYLGSQSVVTTAGTSNTISTSGFIVPAGQATRAINGIIELKRIAGTNIWLASGVVGTNSGTTFAGMVAGTKTLSDVITTVRLTRTGADTFDAGQAMVVYR